MLIIEGHEILTSIYWANFRIPLVSLSRLELSRHMDQKCVCVHPADWWSVGEGGEGDFQLLTSKLEDLFDSGQRATSEYI